MISSFQLKSAADTASYHADAFDIAKTREARYERVPSAWGGNGAAHAGFIAGSAIQGQDFLATLEGRIAGQELAGGWLKTDDGTVLHHKPGMDFTFSPGKSVSIAALVGKDDRIIAAHEAAVEAGMRFLEAEGSQYRAGGKQAPADNLLYSKFSHIVSRQQDPQVHTHVVVHNAVRDADGAWHALDNSKLLDLRKAADAIYGQTLERHLNALGYRTEQGKSGPEIRGIPDKLCTLFSSRQEDIRADLDKHGINYDTAHVKDRQQSNFATRPPKVMVSRSELEKLWSAKAMEIGIDLRTLARQPDLSAVVAQARPHNEIDLAIGRLVEQQTAAKGILDQRMDQRIAAIRDPQAMVQRARAIRRNQTDKLGPTAEIRVAENTLHGVTAKQISASLTTGTRYADPRQLTAALERAVAAGTLHVDKGRYSIESPAAQAARHALALQANRAERQATANAMLASVIGRFEAAKARSLELRAALVAEHEKQARAPAGTEDYSRVMALSEQLRKTSEALSPVPGGLLVDQVKNTYPGVAAGQIQQAIKLAVADGKLQVQESKNGKALYGVESAEETQARRAAERTLSRTPAQEALKDKVAGAWTTVQSGMQAAREHADSLVVELKIARTENNTARIEALQKDLAKARGEMALSEGQIGQKIRNLVGERQVETRPEKLAEQLADQARGGLSHADLADRRADRLAEYADKLSGKAADAQHDRVKSPVNQADIDAAIRNALESQAVHRNAGKISCETEAQTDQRNQQLQADRKEISAVQRAIASVAKAADRTAKYAAQRQERQAEMAKLKEENFKKLAPDVQRAIKRSQSTSYKVGKGLRTASQLIRNPGKFVAKAATRATLNAFRDTSTGLAAGVWAVAAGSLKGLQLGAQAVAGRTSARDGVLEQSKMLKGKQQLTALSTLGYRTDAEGNVTQAKANMHNVVLIGAVKALEVSQLTHTTFGKALRNELVQNITQRQVGGLEAMAAKLLVGMVKGNRAVVDWRANRADRRQEEKLVAQVEKTMKPRQEAYANLVKAQVEHQAGRLDAAGLQAAHGKLEAALGASDKAHGALFKHAEKLHSAGRMSDSSLAYRHKQFTEYKQAAEMFRGKDNQPGLAIRDRLETIGLRAKQENQMPQSQQDAERKAASNARFKVLGMNSRELAKVERDAGVKPTSVMQVKADKLLDVKRTQEPKIEKHQELATSLEKREKSIAAKHNQPTPTNGKEAKMDNANDRLLTPRKDREATPEKDLATGRDTAERLKKQERDHETAAAERDTKRDSAQDRKQERSKDRGMSM